MNAKNETKRYSVSSTFYAPSTLYRKGEEKAEVAFTIMEKKRRKKHSAHRRNMSQDEETK